MQSVYGKLQQVAKQALNHLRSVELRNFSSFEPKPNPLRYVSSYGSAFSLEKNFVTKNSMRVSAKRHGLASVLPSHIGLSLSLNQSDTVLTTQLVRNITTSPSTSQDASASPEVPQRIKFKRLDKTARHIMQIIDKEAVEEAKANQEIPDIKPGYIIQLKVEVPENKRRVSIIKGIVIARRNAGLNTTFRIRRLVAGVGIESLFPLYSPNIKEIKVLDKKKVRRAKLYYLRDKMNALKKQ